MQFKTIYKNKLNTLWGLHTPFCKSLLIRGIGYRAFIFLNDIYFSDDEIYSNVLQDLYQIDMPYAKYLIINAGHTENLHQSLPVTLRSKTTKKDRKLTIFSSFKSEVSYLSKLVIQYRQPSVYTGRGIREKGTRVLRKAGKKDKQKGKSF